VVTACVVSIVNNVVASVYN